MTDKENGGLSLADRLASIDKKLEDLTGFPQRLRALETVVYSGCGLVLVSVVGAIITLVVKG